MQSSLLEILRCPVTRSKLKAQTFIPADSLNEIEEGILFAEKDWFYPVIAGIPRLNVEAFLDYPEFFQRHLSDYTDRKRRLVKKYQRLIKYVIRKNRRTRKSFTHEWRVFDYSKDKTWNKNSIALLEQFMEEADESDSSISDKWIFDAGCGNGVLDQQLAQKGAKVIAMDFSLSVEKAAKEIQSPSVQFVQGDIQLPPVAFSYFDIVYCSGVLIHTNNTELSFSCIEPCVKAGGKLSVWLYHPRKNLIHNAFNFIRRGTSKLPARFQYYLYHATIFPAVYIVKRLKGNRQNRREMMIDLLDWLSPEFRWEHEPSEAASWFYKRHFHSVKITTNTTFGFNIIGIKGPLSENENRHF